MEREQGSAEWGRGNGGTGSDSVWADPSPAALLCARSTSAFPGGALTRPTGRGVTQCTTKGSGKMDAHMMGILEQRNASHRRAGSLGRLPLESRVPVAVLGCSTVFLCGVASAMLMWKGVWNSHWRALGTDGMEAMPLASVPISLIVATLLDGFLRATSALGRGKMAVSPLTPRLCAIMAVLFAFLSTTHLPSLGCAALREMSAGDIAWLKPAGGAQPLAAPGMNALGAIGLETNVAMVLPGYAHDSVLQRGNGSAGAPLG